MPVQVWTVGEFLDKAKEQQGPEPVTNDAGVSWLESVRALGERAHARGDGVAIYVNQDLGHPDIGQWQVTSYGSDEAQVVSRDKLWNSPTFTHGADNLPMTLPDIGGSINYRYQLEAIVPSYEQDAKANEFGTPGYSATPPTERLVVVQVKVTGGATEEEALAVVKQACWAGLANWQDSAGEVGFLPEESIGPDAYDKGVRVELIDSAVI